MVNRSRLYERAQTSAAPIVAFVAPAGFGKSYVAREIAMSSGRLSIYWDAAFAPSAEMAKSLRAAWETASEAATIIFDSLEAIRGDTQALGVLAEAIRSKGRRTIVLAARPPFPLLNSRVLPPGSYVRFGPDDLRFTADDVRIACGIAAEREIESILEITGGWPFGVLALAEPAASGRLAAALESVRAGTSTDVSDYLSREVIGSVEDSLLPLLIAIQAVGEHGIGAIGHASAREDAREGIEMLAAVVPILESTDGSIRLHPLLRGVVERRFAEAIERSRAALRTRTFALRATTLAPAELVAEVERMRESLPRDADATIVRSLDAYLAFFALEAGQIEYAQTVLSTHLTGIRIIPSSTEEAILLAAQGRLYAARYQVDEAIDFYQRALPYVENDGINATIAVSLAFLEFLRCNYEATGTELLRALALARRSGHQITILEVLMHGVFCAWLAGDEIEYQRWLALFEAETRSASLDSLTPFIRAIQTKSIEPLNGKLSPRWRAYTALMVAGGQDDQHAVETSLEWAKAEAAIAADSLAELLALLACSIAVPAQRDELQGRIGAMSVRIAAPALRESVEAYFAGSDGAPILTRFIRRFAASPAASNSPSSGGTLRVNVLAGTISHGETVLKLSNRPMALMLTLATMGSLSRERLCETLWPDADEISAANTLKMCVRRARQQLDDPSAVVFEKGLWSLRDDIVVDIVEIERNLRSIPSNESLSSMNRTYLESIFEFLAKMKPAEIFNSEGMEAIGLRANGIRHQVVARLGDNALANKDLAGALNYAEILRRWDPTDEMSYMLSIRAYALAGNNAEAYREYRQYSAQCERELGIKPELSIEDLIKQPVMR